MILASGTLPIVCRCAPCREREQARLARHAALIAKNQQQLHSLAYDSARIIRSNQPTTQEMK